MLYDRDTMGRFAGMELGDDRIFVDTTILNVRYLLEKHHLSEKLFAEGNAYFVDKGITLHLNTLVDATIIDAPSSTKNAAKLRDPEMSSTKKSNNWYFSMKTHMGADAESNIVHSLETKAAEMPDRRVWGQMIHGDETSGWADKGHVNVEREAAFSRNGRVWGIKLQTPKGGELDPLVEQINKVIANVRAKVEHPFRAFKQQFGRMTTADSMRRHPPAGSQIAENVARDRPYDAPSCPQAVRSAEPKPLNKRTLKR